MDWGTLLAQPTTPFALGTVIALLAATWASVRRGIARSMVLRLRALPTASDMATRRAIGLIAAAACLSVMLGIVLGMGLTGTPQLLAGVTALGLSMFWGLVWPRRPLVRQQQEARQLRALTPSMVAYLRTALRGGDTLRQAFERYSARDRATIRIMQQVLAAATDRVRRGDHPRPGTALLFVVMDRGCQELRDIARALADAETSGTPLDDTLAIQQTTLESILADEFTRDLKRKMLILIGVTAVTLIVGILGSLLFVMVAGIAQGQL